MSAWNEVTVLDDTISDLAKCKLQIQAGDAYKNKSVILRRYNKDYMKVTLDSNAQAEVNVTPKSDYELVSDDTAKATSGKFKVGTGESIEVMLDYIPDGKTVLPLGDVVLLQRCAQVYSTFGYDTIEKILADSTCINLVFSNTNAIDYMIRSEDAFRATVLANLRARAVLKGTPYAIYQMAMSLTWSTYINNLSFDDRHMIWNAIPPITARNTGGSTTLSSSEGGTYFGTGTNNAPLSAAFDGVANASDHYGYSNDSSPRNVGYIFPYSVILKKAIHSVYASNGSVRSVKTRVSGSNDGNIWVPLLVRDSTGGAVEDSMNGRGTDSNTVFDLSSNTKAFNRYRIEIDGSNYKSDSYYTMFSEVVFEGAKLV